MRTLIFAILTTALSAFAQTAAPSPIFSLSEFMVPMRDGIKLQTVVITPINQSGPLPILLERTPYGVPR